jgi:hypothetical protein
MGVPGRATCWSTVRSVRDDPLTLSERPGIRHVRAGVAPLWKAGQEAPNTDQPGVFGGGRPA